MENLVKPPLIYHTPVMLQEMLEYLSPKDNEHYLDCTFGSGGFSKAILDSSLCKITALDQDPNVVPYVKLLQKEYHNRFSFKMSNFSNFIDLEIANKFDGVVMDLGMSFMQINDNSRGFSFSKDGPLDMRMSRSGITAADFINKASERDIANIIKSYGEERAARKIAKNIVKERKIQVIDTTFKLTEIIYNCIGFKKGKINPATKTFQGIRIFINDELEKLEYFLLKINSILKLNARIVIISFHSLEDRISKNFFRNNAIFEKKNKLNQKFTYNDVSSNKWLKILTKKPVAPSLKEIKENPRSRSAKLRAGIKYVI